MSDDSKTALARKLGIAPGNRIQLCDEPEGFRSTLGELPDGVEVVPGRARNLDMAIIFSQRAADLRFDMPHVSGRLTESGHLWVAWPKRASERETDLCFDVVQKIGLRLGMMDSRVCSLGAEWSGLRFERRRDARSAYAPMWPAPIADAVAEAAGARSKDPAEHDAAAGARSKDPAEHEADARGPQPVRAHQNAQDDDQEV